MNEQIKRDETEIENEILELEKELELSLHMYDVEFPSEEELLTTIEKLRPFVPTRKKRMALFHEGTNNLLKRSMNEVFYISPLFWIANSLLLLISVIGTIWTKENPYHLMLVLAPLPTITGLIEVLKSRNEGMEELEMSFAFSFQEIILAKMLVIGVFNLGINIVTTFILSLTFPDIFVGKLLLFWITPFTILTALAFLLIRVLRNVYVITGAIILWIACSTVIGYTSLLEKMEHVPVGIYFVMIIVAAAITLKKMYQLYKGEKVYEAIH